MAPHNLVNTSAAQSGDANKSSKIIPRYRTDFGGRKPGQRGEQNREALPWWSFALLGGVATAWFLQNSISVSLGLPTIHHGETLPGGLKLSAPRQRTVRKVPPQARYRASIKRSSSDKSERASRRYHWANGAGASPLVAATSKWRCAIRIGRISAAS
jgi:hypothetical protein